MPVTSALSSHTMHTAFVPTVVSLRRSAFTPGVVAWGPVSAQATLSASTPTMSLGGKNRGRRFRGLGGGGMGSGGSTGSGKGGFGGKGLGGRGSGGSGGPSSLSGDSNPFSRLLSWYLSKVSEAPITTKILTSFIGFSLAAIIVNSKGVSDISSLNWSRIAKIGLIGALVHGFGGHYYYPASERALPGITAANIAGKTIVDFLVWLPFISVAHDLVHEISKGYSLDAIRRSVTDNWKLPAPIWLVWSGVMFRVTAVPERILYYNGVIVLSALAQRLAEKADK